MDGEVYAGNTSEEAKSLAGLVDQPIVSKFVKDKLVDFISYNSYHLPMYARPGFW